jgi:membrane-associated phospholipid phosphatase
VSLRSATAALAALYAVLAVLVATGALNGIDQWSIDHLTARVGGGDAPTIVESALPLLHSGWGSWVGATANIVTLPGQALVSLAILLALRNPWWVLAWAAGCGIELLSKAVIVRPALYGPDGHIAGFDSSFPSGHTLRVLLVAAALATVWPRARPLLAAWAAAALVLLEVAGHHVPSDIVGGAVVAGFVLALLASGRGARALRARGLARRAR